MRNRQTRIMFTILSGMVLLLISGISSSYAQGTVDFGGTWNTVTSNGRTMTITLETVRRTNVTGNYGKNLMAGNYQPQDRAINAFVKVSAISGEPAPQDANTIRGTVTDNVLTFKWFEYRGHGAGRFTMSSDGQSFEGTFSLTDDPNDTSGGTWNGTRQASFGGAWQGKFGEGAMELVLQQSGNQVSGRLRVNSAVLGTVREGIIDGNTLRFKLFRPNPMGNRPDDFVGMGELTMDPGGSRSFTGTILETSTSGTRIGR